MSSPVSTSEQPRSLGPYDILGVLGAGGMGVVYRAVHQLTGQRVALKTVRAPQTHQIAGIRREILALSRIQHPGVVRILETGLQSAVPWYAMELLEGETLENLTHHGSGGALAPRPAFKVAANGKLPEALTILRRLCATLSYLHGEGIVHRDLKPSNVFICPTMSPVLVDFGLVWRANEDSMELLDIAPEEAGTAGYMAPEYFRGEHGDARSDLYSLGCIFYEVVTGHLPFEGATLQEIKSGHLALTPQRPSTLVEGVPPELDQLILNLLEKQPRRRVGYASDVEEILGQLGAESDPNVPASRTRVCVYRPALVGREEALLRLRQALNEAKLSEGSIVLLSGESGIGKTSLAMAFAREAIASGFAVVTGSSKPPPEPEGATGTPLQPLRRLFQVLADRCMAEGPGATASLFGPQLPVLAPYEPSLAELPGADYFPPPPPVSAQAARARLIDAVHGVLRAYLLRTPLLLLLDDLQWLDELSTQVLLTLPPELFRRGLMVLGTCQNEPRTAALRGLRKAPNVQEISLPRLGESSVDALIAGMLGTETPPPHLVQFLSNRCQGNPFFIAEYLRIAVEEGLLTRPLGRWQTKEEAGIELPLPETLSGLVQRRIASLSPEARVVLEGASVLGKECSWVLLEQLVDLREDGWYSAIAELRKAHLFEESEGTLRLAHDKLREAAYAGIPAVQRAELHLRAGRLLEKEDTSAPRLLASHFIAGKDHTKAIFYLEIAGQIALQSFSNREALQCYQQAQEQDRLASILEPSAWEQVLASGIEESRPHKQAPRSPGHHREESHTRQAAALRRARWARQQSEAAFRRGDLVTYRQQALLALELLGFPAPRDARGWSLELLKQLVIRARLRVDAGAPRTPLRQAMFAEASGLMMQLSERFSPGAGLLPFLVTSLTAANLTARASRSG